MKIVPHIYLPNDAHDSVLCAEERSLLHAHSLMRAWLFDRALPFWARVGRDGDSLGFQEYLAIDGSVPDVTYKRLRVQARQVYVYSNAALLGWPLGVELATHGYDFVLRHARRSDGGWIRTMGRNGGIVDSTVDLYDLAFTIFALAWYARASRLSQPLDEAVQIVAWIQRVARHPAAGYVNSFPQESGFRQQNPHMHLLEAILALYEVTGDKQHLLFGRRLVELLKDCFVDWQSGTLGEYFLDDLKPVDGEAGDHIEPGHHYEWVWLLDQYSRLTGDDQGCYMRPLYDFAEAYGVDRATGAIVDVVNRKGDVLRASQRVWPQAEAIKARCVMANRSLSDLRGVSESVNVLMSRHFTGCPVGTWREHLDQNGHLLVDRIPASSFYHIFMAFNELERLVAGRQAGRRRTEGQPPCHTAVAL